MRVVSGITFGVVGVWPQSPAHPTPTTMTGKTAWSASEGVALAGEEIGDALPSDGENGDERVWAEGVMFGS